MLHQSQRLESASWWKSVSVTQPQWSPAASLSCDKVPASLGQGYGCGLGQGFRTDQPGRRGGGLMVCLQQLPWQTVKQIWDICTPPTFLIFGRVAGRSCVSVGMVTMPVWPCSQPWPLLPLCGEGAVQPEIGCVFLERQPLPSHF